MDIIKAIIPAAGLGTRFLPFTKAVPKEMIPLLNKPAIQHIVEELVAAELSHAIFVTSKDKQALADHFDHNTELKAFLKEREKEDLLHHLDRLINACTFMYVRQPEPRGLGHAIWTARHLIGKEYFSILLPDDIIISKAPAIAQIAKVARQERASVIAVQEVGTEEIASYGIIGIKKQISPNLFQVSHLIEKPDQKSAPSNLAIIGRYILSHKIFQSLEEIEADENEELQLTDAIGKMLYNNEKVFAYKIQGIRYDIGTPLGWLKATIGCALQDPQYSAQVHAFLQNADALDMFLHSPAKIAEKSY